MSGCPVKRQMLREIRKINYLNLAVQLRWNPPPIPIPHPVVDGPAFLRLIIQKHFVSFYD